MSFKAWFPVFRSLAFLIPLKWKRESHHWHYCRNKLISGNRENMSAPLLITFTTPLQSLYKCYHLRPVLFLHRTLKAEDEHKCSLRCWWFVFFSTHERVLFCKVLHPLHPYFYAQEKLQEDKTSQTWSPYIHAGWVNQIPEAV